MAFMGLPWPTNNAGSAFVMSYPLAAATSHDLWLFQRRHPDGGIKIGEKQAGTARQLSLPMPLSRILLSSSHNRERKIGLGSRLLNFRILPVGAFGLDQADYAVQRRNLL